MNSTMSSNSRACVFLLAGGIPDAYDCNKVLERIVEAEVQGYLTELGILRKQKDAIQGLNDEAVNWNPLPKEQTDYSYADFHAAYSLF